MEAIELTIINIGVAFEVLPDGNKDPFGCHKVTGHLVWHFKTDFTLVLDSPTDPIGLTYAGFLSCDSV